MHTIELFVIGALYLTIAIAYRTIRHHRPLHDRVFICYAAMAAIHFIDLVVLLVAADTK